jgi:hypothetical protein
VTATSPSASPLTADEAGLNDFLTAGDEFDAIFTGRLSEPPSSKRTRVSSLRCGPPRDGRLGACQIVMSTCAADSSARAAPGSKRLVDVAN